MTYHLMTTNAPRTATVRITGDLDYETIDNLLDVASQLLTAQEDLTDLHLDFSATEFLDSAALSGLLLLHRRTSQASVGFHLDHRPAFLDRVLQVTGLFNHFDLTRSDDEAGDPNLMAQNGSRETSAR
jgi:anti-anti-sigma factor